MTQQALNVLVTGGSGFVGPHLTTRLLSEGHHVTVMTRTPSDRNDGAIEVAGDVSKPETLARAVLGADIAYYLVHSLDRGDFEAADREGAFNFAIAAKAA